MTGSAFQQVAGAARTDGWLDDAAEAWTYVSGSGGGVATFTVAGDQTAKYTVGTRIRLTQTTIKYFVVSADPTYNSGTGLTTVTIMAGSDYTLANAAISGNFHSYSVNPQGYPGWFAFAGAPTGFSAFTDQTMRFAVVGRTCTLQLSIVGTSNATTFTITAPIAASGNVSAANTAENIARILNNGVADGGLLTIPRNSTTITAFKDVTGNGWTASGQKGALTSAYIYEI